MVFSAASLALSLDPFRAERGALWLIGWRIVQAVGGAMLTANSAAILTDAFPASQRGMALGINQITALAGQFLGLVAGGLLAEIDWRAVFWVSVPFGVIGTIWSYRLAPTGVLGSLPAGNLQVLTGKRFFPELISGPFHHGLVIVFSAAACMAAIAALASLLRGRRYFHEEREPSRPAQPAQVRRIAR